MQTVRTESDVFRSEGIERLMAGVAPHKCATGAAATESGGLAQWQLALDFVARSENLRCSCHAVERIPSVGRGRATQFVPIRFAFTNKLTRHDKLLLAFDALVISRLFGREVTLGRIIYGDDRVTLNVKVSALKNEVEKLTDKIGVLISSPSPPDLILNRHCAECEFDPAPAVGIPPRPAGHLAETPLPALAMKRSHSRSATVTGDASDLVSTGTPLFQYRKAMTPACFAIVRPISNSL